MPLPASQPHPGRTRPPRPR